MSPTQKLALLFTACGLAAAPLMAREGWVLRAYPDPVVGWKVPTACGGVTEGVVKGAIYTEEECLLMTAQAMVKHTAPILPCVRDNMTPLYLSKMVSMSHNIGTAGFLGSTMCRQMKAGNYKAACDAIPAWFRAGGKDCRIRSNDCYGLWLDRLDLQRQCLATIPQNGALRQ